MILPKEEPARSLSALPSAVVVARILWVYGRMNKAFVRPWPWAPHNPAGYEQVGGICRTFTKMGGKVVEEIWPKLGTQDFKPFFAQIKPDADVIMVFFAGGDAARFVQQFSESGLKGKIALVGKGFLVDENMLAKNGKDAEGIVTESHWSLLLDGPENNQFKTAYAKKYGHPPTLYQSRVMLPGWS